MTDSELRGRVVVVTGASRGIGAAAARAFCEAGAHVAMLARSGDQLAAEAAAIGELAVPIVADVSDPDDVRRAFARIDDELGGVDVLVNNAGVTPLSPIDELTDAQIAETVGTNLLGPIYTTRAAIPLLRRHGRGDIINISSESTALPFPYLGLYAASKAGLETFSEATTAELKGSGIRVTVVVCGTTMTEFGRDWHPDVVARFLQAASESGHLAFASAGQPMDPADVARTLVFVATRPRSQVVDHVRVRAHNAVDVAATFDLAAPRRD